MSAIRPPTTADGLSASEVAEWHEEQRIVSADPRTAGSANRPTWLVKRVIAEGRALALRPDGELLEVAAGKAAPTLAPIARTGVPDNDRPHPFETATQATYERDVLRVDAAIFAAHCDARRNFPNGTDDARRRLQRALTLLDKVDQTAERLRALEDTTETG